MNIEPRPVLTVRGIVSTAADLNRFYSALLTGKLLRPEELEALQTTVPTDQPNKTAGLGIGRTELGGHRRASLAERAAGGQ